ncbi:unnamed protein product [marine sediment metagenome]|uniref:Uncharacterized protein n=1 Tax=marine sediment metagenome TaxID=412755 RepID=X1JG38_9ZZZZ
MTNLQTQTQQDLSYELYTVPSGDWHRDYEAQEPEVGGLIDLLKWGHASLCQRTIATSAIFAADGWIIDKCTEVKTSPEIKKPLFISDLGWTREQALETYLRFRTFKEDWEAPGMEAYDEL